MQQLSQQVTHHVDDGIGVWSIDDMNEALESGELEDGEDHFVEVAGQESMNAVIVEVGGADDLSTEALEHVNDKWTELGEKTGIDATAYVAEGLGRLAISNKNEAEGMDTKGFSDYESAKEWAEEYQ